MLFQNGWMDERLIGGVMIRQKWIKIKTKEGETMEQETRQKDVAGEMSKQAWRVQSRQEVKNWEGGGGSGGNAAVPLMSLYGHKILHFLASLIVKNGMEVEGKSQLYLPTK